VQRTRPLRSGCHCASRGPEKLADDFVCDVDPVAKSYEVELSVDPVSPTSWQKKMTVTKSSGTIMGLTSSARMWVRVRAIGAHPQPGPWSDPAAKTVP
jgi:hypothetical protein